MTKGERDNVPETRKKEAKCFPLPMPGAVAVGVVWKYSYFGRKKTWGREFIVNKILVCKEDQEILRHSC